LSTANEILEALESMETMEESFQSIFIHAPLERKKQLEENYFDSTGRFRQIIYNILKDNGVLWYCANNIPTPEGLDTFPLQLAFDLQASGFHTRNVILWYNLEYSFCSNWFKNRYTYILFLTKDPKNYKFNIDKVREPHIWKDSEWGGGRRSRYHPLGKNPSNFWLKVISKGGKILDHIPLTWGEMVRRCLQSCTEIDDKVLGIVPKNRDFEAVCKDLGLKCRLVQASSERCSSSSIKHSIAPSSSSDLGEKSPRIFFKSSESMNELENGEIQVAVTSPPYWGLRDYGVSSQIGFNESYSTYLSRLETVWTECFRVLHDTGTLWININKRWIDGKILVFPVDIIQSCVKIGFILQDLVMWFRPISVPGTGRQNFTDRYEFIMMFSKNDRFKFHPGKIKKRDFLNEEKGTLINIWKLYRKIGNLSKEFSAETRLAKKHTAMFPKELVSRVVLLSSDEGDTILDPFLGSGTTIAVAENLGRRGVGYEINEAFEPLIKAKIRNSGQSMLRFLK